ncbi:MAG: peptidylprolyl isomerase [Clostridia bacterium]|nr:peptidylprolyl isomerase [Clostridia bacterium]
MKKIISVLLISILIISSLAGCKSESKRFEFEVNGFTLDLTEVAERFYDEKQLNTDEVYEKFKGYSQLLSNYLYFTNEVTTAYPDEDYGFQLEEPSEGEEIAIMHTNMGDIYIRFFPEGAPKAVENFKTHAKNGYYNGLKFFRIMEDAYIQSGDPKNDGTGGASIWGADFEDEFDQKLLNLRGAISMANRGINANGSQFIINQNKPALTDDTKAIYDIVQIFKTYVYAYEYNIEVYSSMNKDYLEIHPTFKDYLKEYSVGFSPVSYLVPEEVWPLYDENGGNIHLDGAWRNGGGNTVFAQVFKGLGVVDVIAKTAVNGETSKPEIDIIINSIEFLPYTK